MATVTTAPPRFAEESRRAYQEAQRQLARLHTTVGTTLSDVFQHVAETVAASLKVSRIGIWLLVDERRAIRCYHLYQPSQRAVFEGTVLRAKDFPSYFRAMETCLVIPVADAQGDPSSHELRDTYLKPLGITSMLDAPIRRGGQVVGVVCHEHIGPMRQWTEEECEFAASVADIVARLFEEVASLQSETSLGVYQAHFLHEQTMEALGRMAGRIAHDVRNVLSAVAGYGTLIAQEAAGLSKLVNLTTGLQEAAECAQNLMQELMTFGQESPVTPCVLDLKEAIERMGDLLRVTAGNDVVFHIQALPRVGRVFMDRCQLERALLNVVVNARDAMPQGGEIHISLREAKVSAEEHEVTYAVVEVRDTGVGMDEATRQHIFEPYFTTKGKKGTGLGLPIVHQVVAHCGGFIKVESEPGRGTCFQLHLPRIAGHERG